MKRLITLALSVILITGCNAMKPNLEETELLWAETEKNIQKWVAPVKTEANPAEKLQIIPEPTVEIPQKTPEPAEEPAPQPLTVTLTPEPLLPEQENTIQPDPPTPQKTELPEETIVMIDWPYPAITCPPEPEWPYITAPEPPTYTPKPEPVEPPQEEPTPTPQPTPAVPPCAPKGYADPVDPTPEPTEQPTEPTPEQPAEQPSGGYAECSCGARLTPEELVPHMKAHAMNGESHSYRAY